MNRLARPALAVALAASLVGTVAPVASAAAQERGLSRRERDERLRRADPSKVVATELAFARLAQEKGQWTAFAEYAADDAVMFVPQAVNAREWLRKQPNPPQAVRWQPHQVWSSCDGTLAVTKGTWQRPDGSFGYFTTVWRRDRKGEYRWVMDQGDTLAQPLEAPEMIGAISAHCARPTAETLPASSGDVRQGQSRDGTLSWQVAVQPDGSRTVAVRYWDGSAWRDAIQEQVAAEQGA